MTSADCHQPNVHVENRRKLNARNAKKKNEEQLTKFKYSFTFLKKSVWARQLM